MSDEQLARLLRSPAARVVGWLLLAAWCAYVLWRLL
jgi:hypothetical protein